MSVNANEVADYTFDVEEDDKKAEEDQDEGEEDDENGIYSEDEDNEIAPAGFSEDSQGMVKVTSYGGGGGSELLSGVCIEKRSSLGIIMGACNRNRSVRNQGPGN